MTCALVRIFFVLVQAVFKIVVEVCGLSAFEASKATLLRDAMGSPCAFLLLAELLCIDGGCQHDGF